MIHPTFHCEKDEIGNVALRNCSFQEGPRWGASDLNVSSIVIVIKRIKTKKVPHQETLLHFIYFKSRHFSV